MISLEQYFVNCRSILCAFKRSNEQCTFIRRDIRIMFWLSQMALTINTINSCVLNVLLRNNLHLNSSSKYLLQQFFFGSRKNESSIHTVFQIMNVPHGHIYNIYQKYKYDILYHQCITRMNYITYNKYWTNFWGHIRWLDREVGWTYAHNVI